MLELCQVHEASYPLRKKRMSDATARTRGRRALRKESHQMIRAAALRYLSAA